MSHHIIMQKVQNHISKNVILNFNEKGSRDFILTLKTTIKQKSLLIGLVVLWCLYYVQSHRLFSEVNDFVTDGSSYVIKILEFTNFRAEQLSLILIEYFILISISIIFSLYIYKVIEYNKSRVLLSVIIINVAFVAIICVISNIFWSIYLLLTLLSILVIVASVYVSKLLWGTTVEFDKGDIVFYSGGFKTESLAKNSLNNQLGKLDKKNLSRVTGEVFNVDKEYFFEIYANDKIILDNKGDFNFHEKN